MKVLIVSEGKSEHLSATSLQPVGDEEVAGALKTLACRIGRNSEQWQITEAKVSNKRVRAHHGKGKGYQKRCIRWMLEAEKRGYDAIVLLVDCDRVESRIAEVDAAQASPLALIKRALGVAVEAFDAWMLADHVALSKVFGSPVQRQPDPESTTNPKESFRRLFESAQHDSSISEHYAEISAIAELAELKNRCPRGFAPFAERVQSL